MSSLRLIPARTLPLFRTGRFSFSTSLTYRKSTVESATETIKNADRKVADKLGEGIEKGGKLLRSAGLARESYEEVILPICPKLCLPQSSLTTCALRKYADDCDIQERQRQRLKMQWD